MNFNLIDDPWIPIQGRDGRSIEVGLAEALTEAHRFHAISADAPVVSIAVLRLLIAITHRVVGPDTPQRWAELWNAAQLPAAPIAAYLDQWRHRFELFDPAEPFHQCPGLNEALAKPAPVLRFVQENNGTLFDHASVAQPDPMTPAEAARWLVAFQCFDVGGIKTNAAGGRLAAVAAPLVGAVVINPKGNSLFETLLLNLVRLDPAHDRPFPAAGTGTPSWERPTPGPEPTSRRPDGYLDWLTFLPRRVRLLANDTGSVERVVVTPGDSLTDAQAPDLEQFVGYRLLEKSTTDTPWAAVRLSTNRAVWRNSAALLSPPSSTRLRPRVLNWIDELRQLGLLDRTRITVTAGGVANDKSKYLLWRLEDHPVPTALLADGDIAAFLEDALALAEGVGLALRRALRPNQSADEPVFTAGAVARTETEFWAAAGQGFDALIAGLPNAPAVAAEQWAQHLRAAADDAVQPLFSGGSGRHLRLVATTERRLRWALRPVFANFEDALEALT